jgi:SAM-dependent methyltransferase
VINAPERPRRLNLGCGTDIREGYVNLDSAALPGVDVVHDISELPLPFDDGAFDEILCRSILEHLDYIPVLRELHRTLAAGGRLEIIGPHFTARNFYVDPTHRTAFSIDTFQFFVKDGEYADRTYYFDFHFSHQARGEIRFIRTAGEPWNWLVEPLVNRSPALQRFYEATFMSRLFPASEVHVTLVK